MSCIFKTILINCKKISNWQQNFYVVNMVSVVSTDTIFMNDKMKDKEFDKGFIQGMIFFSMPFANLCDVMFIPDTKGV